MYGCGCGRSLGSHTQHTCCHSNYPSAYLNSTSFISRPSQRIAWQVLLFFNILKHSFCLIIFNLLNSFALCVFTEDLSSCAMALACLLDCPTRCLAQTRKNNMNWLYGHGALADLPFHVHTGNFCTLHLHSGATATMWNCSVEICYVQPVPEETVPAGGPHPYASIPPPPPPSCPFLLP